MNRQECEKYIQDYYGIEPDHPWFDEPDISVFRHRNNRKWFGLLMTIPWHKLDEKKQGNVDVINVKAEPALIGAFLSDEGFYPAYHMNKTYWITIVLDGSVPADKIEFFLENSYNLTKSKNTRKVNE